MVCNAQPLQGHIGQNYALSLSPLFGLVYGQAEELVYPVDTKAPLLSELLWDMKPVFYYGLLLDFSQINPRNRWGFFSNVSLKMGIPGPSGKQENRDWQSTENANLTDFSRHDNHTRELFLLDFRCGLSFPVNRFLIKPFFHVSFKRLSFYGTDGYGIYARLIQRGIYYPIDDDPRLEQFSGKVISYTQEWIGVAPGVSVTFFWLHNFFTELSFMVSPLVYCSALDEHKEGPHMPRGRQFRDYMLGGIWIEPALRLSYAVKDWLTVSWGISWRHISGTKGNSYFREPIGTGTYRRAGQAGAGLSMLTTGLQFKVRL